MDYGAASNFASGLIKGTEIAEGRRNSAEARRLKQEQLTQKKEEYEYQKSLRPLAQQTAELQLEKQQLELNNLKKESMKKDIFASFDNNSLIDFNNLLSTSQPLQKTLGGAVKVERLSSQQGPELQRLKQQSKGMSEPVVAVGPDGTKKVMDMKKYKDMNGYSAYKQKKDFELEKEEFEKKKLEYNLQALAKKKRDLNAPKAKEKTATEKKYDFYASKFGKEKADEWLQGEMGTGESDTSPSKPQFQQDVIRLEQKQQAGEELTPAEQLELDAKKKYITTDSDEKRQVMADGMAIVSKYRDNLDSDISKEDVIAAKLAQQQAGTKVDATRARELKNQYTVVSQGKKLAEHINSVGEEEIARGFVDQPKDWFLRKFNDVEFNNLDTNDKKKVLLTALTDSKLGNFLAKYVKSISGTAVAEAEYQRLAKVLKGGSDMDNIQTLKTSLNTFVTDLASEFITDLDTEFMSNPALVLDLRSQYNNNLKQFYKTAKSGLPKTNQQSAQVADATNDGFLDFLKAN